jgi:hypothetical protein
MKRLIIVISLVMLSVMAFPQNDSKPNLHMAIGTTYFNVQSNEHFGGNIALSVYHFYFSYTTSTRLFYESDKLLPSVSILSFGYKINQGWFSLTPTLGYITTSGNWMYEATFGAVIGIKLNNRTGLYFGASRHEYGTVGMNIYF